MATKLNAKTENPANKRDITKAYMLDFIDYRGTDEDKEWFLAIIKDKANYKDYNDNFHGGKRNDIDLAKVREMFVERFFPNLRTKKEKKSYLDDAISRLSK